MVSELRIYDTFAERLRMRLVPGTEFFRTDLMCRPDFLTAAAEGGTITLPRGDRGIFLHREQCHGKEDAGDPQGRWVAGFLVWVDGFHESSGQGFEECLVRHVSLAGWFGRVG